MSSHLLNSQQIVTPEKYGRFHLCILICLFTFNLRDADNGLRKT